MKKSLIKIVFLLAVASSAHAEEGSIFGTAFDALQGAAAFIKPEASLSMGIAKDSASVTNEANGTNGGVAQAGLSNQANGAGLNLGFGMASETATVNNTANAEGSNSLAQAGLTNQVSGEGKAGLTISVGVGIATGQSNVKNTATAKEGGTAQAGLSNQVRR